MIVRHAIADCLIKIALIYRKQSNFKEEIRCLNESLEITEQIYGKSHEKW